SLAPSARVEGEDRIAVGADRSLASLRIDEHVVVRGESEPRLVADVVAELVRAADEAAPAEGAIAMDDMVERAPVGAHGATPDGRRAMREQRAAGLTLDRMEAGIAAYGGGARLESGFVTAAAALIQLEPAYATGLEHLFERGDSNAAMRALVCDVLVSA